MVVSDYYSVNSCNSIFTLEKILKKRYKDQSNEFILEANGGFPQMKVLIIKNYACVQYFRNENDNVLYACNDDNYLDKDKKVIFHTGNESNETEIPYRMVIPVKQALCIAECFLINESVPGGVRWIEL